jgi:hypothetical protein
MTAARAMIGLIAVLSLFVGRATGASHPVAPQAPAAFRDEVRASATIDFEDLASIPGLDVQAADELLDPPHYDVYGNEVQEAVGDYRIDPAGGMYESHSPDTEVAHLGPKTS